MNKNFDADAIKEMSEVFQTDPSVDNNTYSWLLQCANFFPNVSVCLFTNIYDNPANVVISVQTGLGYYELHNIKEWGKFAANEIVFLAEMNDSVTVMFIGKSDGVSFYSNIDKKILEEDVTQIDPAFLIAYMQLSIINDMKEITN
jgi:hypothetical protein